jgi:hypothetical protein
VEESITVSADEPIVDTQTSPQRSVVGNDEGASQRRQEKAIAQLSLNVVELQRRTSGVLAVPVDVPRAGTSHQFVKPLVVDQETTVKLRYRRR